MTITPDDLTQLNRKIQASIDSAPPEEQNALLRLQASGYRTVLENLQEAVESSGRANESLQQALRYTRRTISTLTIALLVSTALHIIRTPAFWDAIHPGQYKVVHERQSWDDQPQYDIYERWLFLWRFTDGGFEAKAEALSRVEELKGMSLDGVEYVD